MNESTIFPLSARALPDYDVVICGGGLAGAAAAVRAASSGAKTLLIESGGELGGAITKGGVAQLLDQQGKGGMVREIFGYLNEGGNTAARRGPRYTEDGKRVPGTLIHTEFLKYYLDRRCREAGADILFYSLAAGCTMEDGRITSLALITESGAFTVRAKVYIDATGNGQLAAFAGCASETGHPETGEPQPASSGIMVTGLENPVPTDSDAAKAYMKGLLAEHGIHVSSEGISLVESVADGVWGIAFNSEFQVMPDDPFALSRAASDARAECVEVFGQLKELDMFRNMRLVKTASHIGVREGRRIFGRYRLTFDDIVSGARFEDAICLVRFCIDVHRISPNDRFVHNQGRKVLPYNIPFRALQPLGCDNLLLAGRCISGDFYAHASYRVACDVIPMGEAAGFAAAESCRLGIPVCDVNGKSVSAYMASLGYEL